MPPMGSSGARLARFVGCRIGYPGVPSGMCDATRDEPAVHARGSPRRVPQGERLQLVETPMPEPGPGEVLVRTQWLSVDPYMRGRMSEARSYAKPVGIGEVMAGGAVGVVVESNDERFAPGETVVGELGWQEHAVVRGGAIRNVDTELAPASNYLSVLGLTGLTAWFGLFDVGRPKPGDTVVVSGAAGAVGQIVGQLARIAGCRTVGIAGGPEKVADLTGLYGYDVGIDYKADDIGAALKDACPKGVDVYFDNVGGEISEAVFRRLAVGARIPICGQISQYNLTEPELAPRSLGFTIVFRCTIQGFLVRDYVAPLRRGAAAARRAARSGAAPAPRARDRGLREHPAPRSSGCSAARTTARRSSRSRRRRRRRRRAAGAASARSRAPGRRGPSAGRRRSRTGRAPRARRSRASSERPLLLNIA